MINEGCVGVTYSLINPFPSKPWLLGVCSAGLLKTLWEKEKLLAASNFSFSHNVFYHFGKLSAIFIKFRIIVCKFFEFGGVQNLTFGKKFILSQGYCFKGLYMIQKQKAMMHFKAKSLKRRYSIHIFFSPNNPLPVIKYERRTTRFESKKLTKHLKYIK